RAGPAANLARPPLRPRCSAFLSCLPRRSRRRLRTPRRRTSCLRGKASPRRSRPATWRPPTRRPIVRSSRPRRRSSASSRRSASPSCAASSTTSQPSLVLFSTLRENEDYLGHHRLPADGTDVVSDEGVLYREFSGHGLVFHPLGNFARLNNLVSAHQDEEAAQAAAALVARGIPGRAGSLRFGYEFPFSAGAPPWTSGMAQAVAAQALA